MFDLTGKSALVTGAASGIGEAIAHALANAGAHVFVTDRDDSNGARVTDATRRERAARDVPARSTSPTKPIVAPRRRRLAGPACSTSSSTTPASATSARSRRPPAPISIGCYAVNVRGVFNVSKAFIDRMLARRAGVIVNTASIAGIVGIKDRLAYATTKFAVVGLTKAMALDHANDGIRVNCVCPGRVETPFVKARLREYPDPEAAYREMAGTQALGRMGTPEEIAAAVLYLASDEAAFVTGTRVRHRRRLERRQMNAALVVDCRCDLGEGLLWCSERRAWLWTDIERSQLWMYGTRARSRAALVAARSTRIVRALYLRKVAARAREAAGARGSQSQPRRRPRASR